MTCTRLIAVSTILLSACDVTGPDFEGPADVTLTPSGMAWLGASAREALGGSLGPPSITGGSPSPIDYTSSNSGVVRVDDAGRLQGVASGTAIVFARLNGRSTEYRVRVRPVRFASIHAGGTNNVCGITTEDELLCWGRAWSAGVQTELHPSCAKSGCVWVTALEDAPELALVETDIALVDLSLEFSRSCGLDGDGRLFCWGEQSLAIGQPTCNAETGRCSVGPAPLISDVQFARIMSRGSGSCGIAKDASAYCWGRQSFGELGGGATLQVRTVT